MKYDLFLSDFDGTLTRADGTISQRNIEAIARYRRKGGVFAVVTGRMLCSIRPRLKELGLTDGYVVAYQGALLADIRTGDILSSEGFSPAEAVRALEELERRGEHIQIYLGDALYCNRRDLFLEIYEKNCGVKGTVMELPLSSLVRERGEPVTKILVMLPAERRNLLLSELEDALGEAYTVTASNPYMVEILPAGVSKARAVKELARRFRVPVERVAAIGDQLNDLPMIEAAGGKFAVAGAEEALRAAAHVVPSAEKDGVAAALEIAMREV